MAIRENLFGRTVIYSPEEEITRDNLLDVLDMATGIHEDNQADIQYLYDYYRGKQPVLERKKTVRPEIQNNIVENRANEIVSFKVGYLMGEPIQYVNRGSDEYSAELNNLNEFMFSEEKAAKDKELADWFHICGTSYRMVLPNEKYVEGEYEAPFVIHTLDPRSAFVVYHSGIGHKPLMGVNVIETIEGDTLYAGYTESHYFEVLDDTITEWRSHNLKAIPIIEYPANLARLGAFEIVLPLLDAINTTESNRVDGLEQFIQSLLVFKGVDINDETFGELKDKGAIKVPIDGDVYFIGQQVSQTETQTLVNDMYQSVLTICGMPNRNGGYSTSDTGRAVIYRDGWSAAESKAKDSELTFKKSEKEFLKLAIWICNEKAVMDLKVGTIEIRFTRRNYENIVEKANVLNMMLNNDKIDPELAFEYCGMFVDPANAYLKSREAYDDSQNKMAEELHSINTDLANQEKSTLTEQEEVIDNV